MKPLPIPTLTGKDAEEFLIDIARPLSEDEKAYIAEAERKFGHLFEKK